MRDSVFHCIDLYCANGLYVFMCMLVSVRSNNGNGDADGRRVGCWNGEQTFY